MNRRKFLHVGGLAIGSMVLAGCATREEDWDECEGECAIIEDVEMEYNQRDLSANTVQLRIEFSERLSGRTVYAETLRYTGAGGEDNTSIKEVRDEEELLNSFEDDVHGRSVYFEAESSSRPTHYYIYINEE